MYIIIDIPKDYYRECVEKVKDGKCEYYIDKWIADGIVLIKCEDAISRVEALKIATTEYELKKIRELPSVNPQPYEEAIDILKLSNPNNLVSIETEEQQRLYDAREKAYSMAIKALSQEPNRDMEEIAEIMKSDVDAETKCKMISNILTAKPHYFELSQEPCDDAVSREAVKTEYRKRLINNLKDDKRNIDLSDYVEEPYKAFCEFIDSLPPVTPSERKGHWIPIYQGDEIINYRCSECELGDTNGSTNLYGWDYCRRCGTKMESEG